MDDFRIIDYTDGFLTVNFLGIQSIAGTLRLAGGICTEIQERLRRCLVNIVAGGRIASVFQPGAMHEFIVHTGYNTGITAAEHVEIGIVRRHINTALAGTTETEGGETEWN